MKKIKFGKNNKANVVIHTMDNKIYLYELKNKKLNIGDYPSIKDTGKLLTVLEFDDIRSINSLHEALDIVKHNIGIIDLTKGC